MQNTTPEIAQASTAQKSVKNLAQDITKDSIMRLMDIFYAKVRADKGQLGEIFRTKIGEDNESWEQHKRKIGSFWGGIFLGEQEYRGAPLRAHLDLPPFPRELFATWLNLFAESCQQVFAPAPAQQILGRANDIAKRFQYVLYEMPH